MRNAIILHGLADRKEYYGEKYPSGSNSHWLPWLQKHLMIQDIKADTPEVPYPFHFNWDSWMKEIERFEITNKTTLVGHSMGGGFLVRYLSEHPEIIVDKVVLVAPWLNMGHEEDTDFFDFTLDRAIVDRAGTFTIFYSDNDSNEVQNTVSALKDNLPTATFREFHEYGHFTLKSMKTDAFPELLEAII